MKRLAGWMGGALWGVVAYQLWKRWRKPAAAPASPAAEPEDRAEELRAKLAEARANDEPAPDEPAPVEPGDSGSVEERRRRVHEEGRAAIDRMNES